MKNDAIAVHGSDAPARDAWREALTLLERDLRRRGRRADTRRATAATPTSSHTGPSATRSSRPTSTTPGCAATPPSSPSAGSRRARPRASSPRSAPASACSSSTASPGQPGRLLASPKLPQRLPRALKPADVAALLDRIPASTPLELRDRALFELAYGCGLRAEELVDLDVGSIDFDAEQVRVEGKGGKTRFVPAGEHALAAIAR